MTSKWLLCSWWSYLISFFLIAIISSVVFGGFRYFMEYRNIIEPGLQLNENTFKFFTKEYLQRRYMGLTAKELPDSTNFPSFRVFSDELDIESMNSDLPSSGKVRFISGHINVDKPAFSSDIEFRYRGGLPLHWFYKKKSLRIKLPPYTTYRDERQFNLVNPATMHTVTDWISYEMARSLGLLTPDYFPARVYINNVSNGLHFFLSRIDESFLRKQKRMPGSIYSGDTKYVPNPFGPDITAIEITYKDKDNLPLIWKDERLWAKGASRNAELKDDRRDIQKFIEIINEKSADRFLKLFESYFDKEKYYLYWGLDTLLGSNHHDLFHNHKLYFDPYKGKFEPIEWDIRFWSNSYNIKDLVLPPLLRQVKLNPILEHERDLVAYRLLSVFPVDSVLSKITKSSDLIKTELEADPLRQAPDPRHNIFQQDKVVPYSMTEYEASIVSLQNVYKNRHAYLKKLFNLSRADYTLSKVATGKVKLNVSVTGNTAIKFSPLGIVPEKLKGTVKISKIYMESRKPVLLGVPETLYPGRMVSKGNILDKVDVRSILTYGNDKLIWSPLHYEYLIEGLDISEISRLDKLSATNALTGNLMSVSPVKELPSDKETDSVHPWKLWQEKPKNKVENVVLSGVVNVLQDRIYSKRQTVTILPGTVIKLAKNKSLIFYGKVVAKGNKVSPIVFKQLVKGEPWGAIVIQGSNATNSYFSYINVSGGSVTSQRLIDYPGQFNIHDVDAFSIENCLIESNKVGDDALHIAYSIGEIEGCRFKNTAFDALDIDISEVFLSNSEFINIGNDALDLMTSKLDAKDIIITGAGDKCISVGEESDLKISNSKLFQCKFGVAVKDKSKAYIEDLEFKDIEQVAIDLYVKNKRYSVGGKISGRRLKGIQESDIRLDYTSKNLITREDLMLDQETINSSSGLPKDESE